MAWREEGEGWSSTFTEEDGSYELTAGPGKWEITIYRPYDTKVDWIYDAAPKRVKFALGSGKETKTKNFTVSRMGGGKIVGTINLPNGVSASDISTYVYVDAFDPEGRGNWAQPEADEVLKFLFNQVSMSYPFGLIRNCKDLGVLRSNL